MTAVPERRTAGGAALVIGSALLGAAALAWVRSRSGERALEDRTRSRLQPRHVAADASDIKIGG